MRTLTNAEYQLEHIMPLAQARGCECAFNEEHFNSFIHYEWQHKPGCLAPLYECLPNAGRLLEALRV